MLLPSEIVAKHVTWGAGLLLCTSTSLLTYQMQHKEAGVPGAQDLAADLALRVTDAEPAQVCLHCHMLR